LRLNWTHLCNAKNAFWAGTVVWACATVSICADVEPSKIERVVSSANGCYYARTVPKGGVFDATCGITRIYRVGDAKDELRDTYNWYAWGLDLVSTARGISVVRLGRWASGDEARRDDLAIGFYLGGKCLREYSTLDIAGEKENVSRSISHYRVFKHVGPCEYQWASGGIDTNSVPEYIVRTTTTDGRNLEFDVLTGEIINRPTETFRLYEDTLTKSQKEFAEAYRVAHQNQDLVALSRMVYWKDKSEEERLTWLGLVVSRWRRPLIHMAFRASPPWEWRERHSTLPVAAWLFVHYGVEGRIPGAYIETNRMESMVFPVGLTNGSYWFTITDD